VKSVILFDFDGTIADTFLTIKNILRELSTKYGYKKLTDEECEKLKDHSVQEIFKILDIPLYKVPFIAVGVMKLLNTKIGNLKPINGIDALLKDLKTDRYVLALITSNSKNNVKIFLQNNKLEVFTYVYTSTTLFGKARVIEKFLHTYSLSKNEAVYIGDEIRDIEATKKVGIPIIVGTWGYNSRKGLERFKPDFIVDKPDAIIPILESFK